MEKLSPAQKLINEAAGVFDGSLTLLAGASSYSERTLKRIYSGEVPLSRFAEARLRELIARGPLAKYGISNTKFGTGSARELAPGEEEPLKRTRPARMIPRIGWAQAGHALVDFSDIVEWEEFVSVPTDDPKAIAITVRGDSMTPEIVDGDIVIVAPSHPLVTGKPVVCRTHQGVMVKNMRREKEGFELRSVNPEHPPIHVKLADVLWIYPVAAIIHFP